MKYYNKCSQSRTSHCHWCCCCVFSSSASASLVYISRVYFSRYLSFIRGISILVHIFIGNQVENSAHCRQILYIEHIFIMHELEIMNNQIFLIQLFPSFLSLYDIISVDGARVQQNETISIWVGMRSKVTCVR